MSGLRWPVDSVRPEISYATLEMSNYAKGLITKILKKNAT